MLVQNWPWNMEGKERLKEEQRATDAQRVLRDAAELTRPARFVLGIHRKMGDSWHLDSRILEVHTEALTG